MWQKNVSWSEGLFSEIPFKRFKEIKTKSQWDSPLAIFTRLNPNKGNDWPNLRLEGIQSPSSPPIRAFDTLFAPDYYIVAIDTRIKATQCVTEIKTQDNIMATATVTIEYQTESLEILLSIDDPLARLKDRAGEIIQRFVSRTSYASVNETDIKSNLQTMEIRNETGISIKSFFNIKINWPEAITQTFSRSVLVDIDDNDQRKINDKRMKKLKDFGINDPVLIASVLSQDDADFDVIMGHVRSASQAYKDQMDRDFQLLSWLKDKDLLTRTDVQNVVESLASRINNSASSLSSPILKGLLPQSGGQQQKIGDGMKSEAQDEDKHDGPKVIGKRTINLSDKSDE